MTDTTPTPPPWGARPGAPTVPLQAPVPVPETGRWLSWVAVAVLVPIFVVVIAQTLAGVGLLLYSGVQLVLQHPLPVAIAVGLWALVIRWFHVQEQRQQREREQAVTE